MKVLTALGLCLTMTALLAGCSKPENVIIGKWRATGRGRGTMEFLKDGTVVFSGHGGHYTFPDDQHIKLDANDGSAAVWGYRIDGDKLFLTTDSTGEGKPVELHRVKE